MATKIEWCFETWNPVWGCNNTCEFCYARNLARRFWKQIASKDDDYCNKNNIRNPHDYYFDIYTFKPIFLESNFNRKFNKKYKSVFVNSMSDIAYWKPEWMKRVLDRIKINFNYNFMFLTKQYEVYTNYNFPKNCWLGVTITGNYDEPYGIYNRNFWGKNKTFYSIEPILNNIDIKHFSQPDWIIVGAETGNRKNKIIPKKEWIENIRMFCQDNDIPYFEKESVSKIVDRELIQQFPKELNINKE
jgi:protein gp37